MGNIYNLAIALAIPALSLTATAAQAHPAIPDADFHKRLEYKARNASNQSSISRAEQAKKINERLFAGKKGAKNAQSVKPDVEFPASSGFETMDAPDGSIWYYQASYDYETIQHEHYTETYIKGFRFDIYDSNLNFFGTVKDLVTLEEGETRAADVQLTPMLSKKFFNIDDKYEVMVTTICNTTQYQNKYHTNVYSINGTKDENDYDQPVFRIDDYLFSTYLNASPDPWGETMYFVFAKEFQQYDEGVDPDEATYQEIINSYKVDYRVYSKASWSGEPSMIFNYTLRNEQLPGDQMNIPAILMTYTDKVPYMLIQKYENNFHKDQDNPMSEDYDQADENNLLIQLYSLSSSGAKLTQETKIPVVKDVANNAYFTWLSVGGLGYTSDINFNDYGTPDGKAAFIITKWNYLLSNDDEYDNFYYVYDHEGNRKLTLFERANGYMGMSDVKGCDPQTMFVELTDDMYTFHFVNMLTGKDEASFDYMINYQGTVETITANIDRVPAGESYKYVVEMRSPGLDADGNDLMRVGWINTDGKFERIDCINMGKNIRLAQAYISQATLSPYIFDTDSEYEYMFLVKRGSETSVSLSEELMIGKTISAEKPEGETILHLTPDPEKGFLRGITPFFTDQGGRLMVMYMNTDNLFSTDIYNLPLKKFKGGEGTEENPYQIASIGDFHEMRSDLSAHYEIVNDIDAADFNFEAIASASKPFAGTLDGKGHTVSGLTVNGTDGGAIFAALSQATIKNIDFINATVEVTPEKNNALIARTASNSTLENIHVIGLDMKGGEEDDVLAGGLIAQATYYTNVKDCSVENGRISVPGTSDSYGVGGLVGETRTSSSIVSSSFVGSIEGGQAVGGILGKSDKNDKIINCHVDADIKALNTVGGLIGSCGRSQVTNCYVEGTIEATEKSRISGYKAGGLIGEMSQYFGQSEEGKAIKAADSAPVPVIITGNVVNVESITVPEGATNSIDNSVHRIVGHTSANSAEIDWDNTTDYENPVYLPGTEEKGLSDNHAVAHLEKIDGDTEAIHTSVEGASVEASDLTNEFFEGLGFAYGETSDAPWNIVPENDPSLYHETGLRFYHALITVEEENDFTADLIIVSRKALDPEEIGGGITCDSSDEDVACMNGSMNLDGNILSLGFTAGKPGNAEITVGVAGNQAKFAVNVLKKTNAIENVTENVSAVRISYSDGNLLCAGSHIEVYSMEGAKVAEGNDSLYVAELPAGVYAAVATDAEGNKSSVKILVK